MEFKKYKIRLDDELFAAAEQAAYEIPEVKRRELGLVMRMRCVSSLRTAEREFIGQLAYFAAITWRGEREWELMEKAFGIDSDILTYIINAWLPDKLPPVPSTLYAEAARYAAAIIAMQNEAQKAPEEARKAKNEEGK